ncbi:type VI secretion system lipoprotein TssJ [Stenotrophomonas sp. Iso1]|uniref:type VI secretion system lipoprotein TssJ n=1 Tax=Stenotrophomonas sp. Iso1 TaxID=2977283 RepID=UPI0022B7C1DD|nr:type VI secretion system lipoprotein TssJ [Stenotrophomonas sp. Iso1]
MSRFSHAVPVAAFSMMLLLTTAGCASSSKLGKAVDSTLQAVGLREAKTVAPPVVPIRLYAGSNLNSANDKRATAAVVKVYHLRSAQRFEQAPFNAFLDQAGEQAALGADLLSVNEIVLTPGVRQELSEKLSDGTSVLGIVSLFRAPAENRWRLAFDANAKELQQAGITIGVHACALTSDSSALLTRVSGDPNSLASVRCVSSR